MPRTHTPTSRGRQQVWRVPAFVATGLATLLGVLALFSATTSAGAATAAGIALITDFDTGTNLNSGRSHTAFTIKLPAGAACSGDTANQNFHIYSYLVLASAYSDPGALRFDSSGPVANAAGQPAFTLYDTSGSPYSTKTAAPMSGFVSNIPPFDYNLFSADGRMTATAPEGTLVLPTGTYNLGIACARSDNTVDRFWNTQVIFTANAADPNGEVWATVPNPQVGGIEAPTTTAGGSTTTTGGASTTTTAAGGGGGSTTTTAAGGGSSTTATAGGGSSTTTSGLGSTTTTSGGGTTTTTGSGTGAVESAGGGTPGGASGGGAVSPAGSLAKTGLNVVVWSAGAAGLAYLGWVGVLLGRRRRLRHLTDSLRL